MRQTNLNRYLIIATIASFFIIAASALRPITVAYHYINANIEASVKEANQYIAGLQPHP